jgi:hypothetical protein
MAALSNLVHSSAGLRISPYAGVSNSDLLFTRDQVSRLWDDQTVYGWGAYDGKGDPIKLTYQDYWSEFLYHVDYAAAPQTSINQPLGSGNTTNNAAEFYPGSTIVEYYYPGFDPKYEGMDWRSLRLVFQQIDGRWYLVGLINAQWTI